MIIGLPFMVAHYIKWCVEFIKRGRDVFEKMALVSDAEKAARDLIYAMKEEVITRVVTRAMAKSVRDMEKANRNIEDKINIEYPSKSASNGCMK